MAGMFKRNPPKPSRKAPTRRLVLEALESRTLLSVFAVDRLSDHQPAGGGEGSGLAGDLRYCLTQASDGDAITFGAGVTGTINLAGALPDLAHSVRIDGPGADLLTVRRDTGGAYRILTVQGAAAVSISGLMISNGLMTDTTGGGIENEGTLTLSDVTVSGNSVTGGDNPGTVGGGGIFNSGQLTITDCTITGNAAVRDLRFSAYAVVGGGGIYNAGSGTLTVTNSSINGNSVTSTDPDRTHVPTLGGGIYSSGMLTVTGSTLHGNSARSSDGADMGAAIDTTGVLTLSDSTLSGNSAHIAAVYYMGTVSIGNSTITDNPAGEAAIEGNGTLTVSNSTIAGNGGYGLSNGSGTVAVSNSTIANNAGYGIRNNVTLTISNSTVTGNTAGGIQNVAFSVDANATLLNCTVADNDGSQLWSGSGYGTPQGTATIQLHNTIISAGHGTANLTATRGGVFHSQGYNLSSDGGGGFLTGTGDRTNADPQLGPLQDNGGPTPTMALMPGSPALNAGDAAQLGVPDQRGVTRAGGVNIGAYQASASAFVLTAPAKVTAGVPFDLTVTAVDPFGQAALGYRGTVTFGTTDPDPGVVLPADYTFTADDAGVHIFTDTGLGETTLVTRGYQTIAVTDAADGSITGSAAVKVRHLRRHEGGPASGSVGSAVGCLEPLLPNDTLPDHRDPRRI